MSDQRPALFDIVRAPGLLATLVPLVMGTSAAVMVTGELHLIGALLATTVGISIHLSMNVYNDIYDTRQGSDSLESSQCFFSGGSGVLITNPELESTMFLIARAGIFVGLLGTIGLIFFTEGGFWPVFVIVYAIAAFLSKYYTAAPVALSYRGLGEIAVFIAFGPLAILLAAASQGVLWDPLLLMIMPITGAVPLIVTLNGQIVDLPYDQAAGKKGLVMFLGLRRALHLTAVLCILLVANVLIIAHLLPGGWITTLFMIPFIIPLPLAFHHLYNGLEERDTLIRGAGVLFASLILCAISLMAVFVYIQIL